MTEESELSPSQENLKDDTVTEVKLETVDPYAKVVNFRAYYNGDNEGTGNLNGNAWAYLVVGKTIPSP